MKKSNYSKTKPKDGEGQLTINIFAMFMSLFVFLFVQQAGILLLNVMFSLGYPTNLDNITNFLGSIIVIIFLTFLFGFASQMGFGIIRRTKAEYKIFIVYNVCTLIILILQGITVAIMTVPMYLAPNVVICGATIYSLSSVIKGVPDSFVNRVTKLRK